MSQLRRRRQGKTRLYYANRRKSYKNYLHSTSIAPKLRLSIDRRSSFLKNVNLARNIEPWPQEDQKCRYIWTYRFRASLRSRRFRLVSEQWKASVLAAREMRPVPKNERGGRGSQFFARSLTLTPCSLLLNRTKTLATQATSVHPLFFVVTYRWRCSWLSSQAAHSKYPWRELVIFPTFLCKMSESVPWAPLRICFFMGWFCPCLFLPRGFLMCSVATTPRATLSVGHHEGERVHGSGRFKFFLIWKQLEWSEGNFCSLLVWQRSTAEFSLVFFLVVENQNIKTF